MRFEEEQLQVRCVSFLTYKYSHVVFHHSPNEGKRTQAQGARLKKMGMCTGFPDLFIDDGKKALYIEFKTTKGRQTPEQKDLQTRLEKIGRKYFLCRSYEDFIKICHENLGPETDPDLEQLRRILNVKTK